MTTTTYTPSFSDLEDGEFSGSAPVERKTDAEMLPAAAPRYATNLSRTVEASDEEVSGQMFREPCRKCGGTGAFRGYSGRLVGSCFACDGKGYKLFRTSSGDRAKARAKAVERKIDAALSNADGFKAAFPAEWALLDAEMQKTPRNAFLHAMYDDVLKYGDLTPNKLAAVQKFVTARAARATENAARVANAPSVASTISPLRESLLKAKASGLKYVRLQTSQFEFSLAKDTGKNPGCIYVKAGDAYLGKITPDGKLQTSRDGAASEAAIVEVCKDPLAAAKLYGKETGRCGCCGRELTDPDSIAAGIGPICAGRYGWAS